MSYLLKTSHNKKPRLKTIILGLFLVLAFIFAGVLQIFFSPMAHFIVDPFFKISQRLLMSTKNVFAFLEPKEKLVAENERLKEELLIKNRILLDYEIIKTENEFLKGISGRHATTTRVIAGVLKTPDQSPYDTIIIDAGKDQGVAEGSFVYGRPDVPIGLVEFVYKNSALVKLYSSPGETYDVYIGVGKVAGRATGRGGGNFEVILPRGTSISEGDIVTMPGITSKTFGVVESIAETEGGTFVRVLFKNPFSFDELRFVEVLI